jgi:hypothetical protein
LEWPVIGGESENFLTFFNVSFEDGQANQQTYWIPLNVTGKEKNNTAGEINSASFKNLGGVFVEERPSEGGVGTVTFTGSFVKPEKVVDKVPAGCRAP